MSKIRIATFNVENLLQRFDFKRYGRLTKVPALELLGVTDEAENIQLRKALHVSHTDDSRQMTAQAIREINADIICMQEVDSRTALDAFEEMYLQKSAGIRYGWRRVIDGNDPRGIDVAVMSKSRIDVVSHAEETFDDLGVFTDELKDMGYSAGDRVFRRDCLEVNLKVGGKELTLFVCHFKSMIGGRDATRPVRAAEATAVRRIIERKFPTPKTANWIVLGDFNDYIHVNGEPLTDHAVGALVGDFSKNILDSVPKAQRWTHYYSGEDERRQLDYILVSPAIAAKNKTVKAEVFRKGMPYRVPGLEKLERYPRVGFDRPKASDHCPVAVTLTI